MSKQVTWKLPAEESVWYADVGHTVANTRALVRVYGCPRALGRAHHGLRSRLFGIGPGWRGLGSPEGGLLGLGARGCLRGPP